MRPRDLVVCEPAIVEAQPDPAGIDLDRANAGVAFRAIDGDVHRFRHLEQLQARLFMDERHGELKRPGDTDVLPRRASLRWLALGVNLISDIDDR
jgi:hypothetical protein